MNKNKSIGIVLYSLSGLTLLMWPFIAFMSIFVFDAPIRDSLDTLLRNTTVILLLSYPLSYFVAIAIFIRKWRKDELRLLHSISGLAPIIHFGIVILIVMGIDGIQNNLNNPDFKIGHTLVVKNDNEYDRLVNLKGEVLIDRQVSTTLPLDDGNTLLVGQALVKKMGKTDIMVTDWYKMSYYAVNLDTESVSLPMTVEQIKEKYGLTDDSSLFEFDAAQKKTLNPYKKGELNIFSNQILDPTWTTPVLKAKSVPQEGQD